MKKSRRVRSVDDYIEHKAKSYDLNEEVSEDDLKNITEAITNAVMEKKASQDIAESGLRPSPITRTEKSSSITVSTQKTDCCTIS